MYASKVILVDENVDKQKRYNQFLVNKLGLLVKVKGLK